MLLTEKSIVRQLAGAGRHVYDSAREDVENRIERNEILREQRLQEREIRMQERAEAYRQIAEELEFVDSPYITSVKYLENEIFVDSNCENEEFPVLLMDWIEGETMETYVAANYTDTLDLLALFEKPDTAKLVREVAIALMGGHYVSIPCAGGGSVSSETGWDGRKKDEEDENFRLRCWLHAARTVKNSRKVQTKRKSYGL